jgi:hypothetical protein
MTDVELTRALECGEIANESFHHLSHLHVAWVYLSESSSADEAAGKMRCTLQKFAASVGKAEKYHETITVFWIQLLHRLRTACSDKSLEDIVQEYPELLEKNFPLRYYSPQTLFSDRARAFWVEPDLKPLPTDATSIHSPRPPSHSSHRLVCG